MSIKLGHEGRASVDGNWDKSILTRAGVSVEKESHRFSNTRELQLSFRFVSMVVGGLGERVKGYFRDTK